MRSAGGYSLWFNRDERVTRDAELPPSITDQAGTAVLAPTDGEAGGTWLAVNEHGVTVSLLNAYVAGAVPVAGPTRSRGLLVRDLAAAAEVDTVVAHLAQLALDEYEPFVLLALGPNSEPVTVRWDGIRRSLSPATAPLVSSGVHAARVTRVRRELFERILAEHGGVSEAALDAFQRSHAGGPGAETPCMHRSDAATRSQCRVRVDAQRVELVHVPGPPCTTSPSPAQALVRRS